MRWKGNVFQFLIIIGFNEFLYDEDLWNIKCIVSMGCLIILILIKNENKEFEFNNFIN